MDKRFLGIDLGKKRIGLAVTDPLNIACQVYKTIYYKSINNLVKELNLIIIEKNIGTVVFGIPLTLNGTDSQKTTETREMIDKIKKGLPKDILIDLEDEALTTVEAHDILRQLGKKPSKSRDIVDQIAAQQILTSYRNRKSV